MSPIRGATELIELLVILLEKHDTVVLLQLNHATNYT